jgi:hypothetical protein
MKGQRMFDPTRILTPIPQWFTSLDGQLDLEFFFQVVRRRQRRILRDLALAALAADIRDLRSAS